MNHIAFVETEAELAGLRSALASDVRQELTPLRRPLVAGAQFNWLEKFCRRRIVGRFTNLNKAAIDIRETEADHRLGKVSSEVCAEILVHDPSFYRKVLFGGTIGAAESYIDGSWSTSDLTKLIQILIRNMDQVIGLDKSWSRFRNGLHWLGHQFRRNTRTGSRKNIHEHYDLGNDFYRLFLDPTMNYSSGVFASESDSMHQASLNKMDRICRKLQLTHGDEVLEIGTGWGGLAVYMAEQFGCRVTTATISREQFLYASQWVKEKGLEDRVTVKLCDYRDLEGSFDKLVSIEMIEAVGYQFYDEYFATCSRLLKPTGTMLIQAITIGEQDYDYHVRNVDFIRSHIFPGGCLPSISAIAKSLGRSTDMRMAHTEDLTPHYATTLRIWLDKFNDSIEAVEGLGFDERFVRMWQFYLCYCEAAFLERRVHLVQTVFAKRGSAVDPPNDYSW